MQPYNRYLIALAAAFGVSTTVLAAYRVRHLDAYLTAYAVAYLLVTLLFWYLHPRAIRVLNTVGYVLLAGFLLVIGLRAAAILGLVRPP